MKAQVIGYNVTAENEFEHRIGIAVRYGKTSYAVTITTFHDFDGSQPVVRKINSFGYLSTIKRASANRDMAIRDAIRGMHFNY